MRGKREAKVGLRKSGDSSAKITSKSMSRFRWHTYRKESGFVIVDGEPRGLLEDLQDVLSLSNGVSEAFEKDKGIVGILEHGGRGYWEPTDARWH